MSKSTRKLRNPLHGHPLLGKGGLHKKTHKAKRRNDKQALRKAWFFPSTGFDLCSEKAISAYAPRNSCHQARRVIFLY